MIMQKRLIFILPLFLLGFVNFAQNTEKNTNEKKHEDWVNLKEHDYSIDYPSNWTFDSSGLMGTKFIIFSELEPENDDFRENINLIIQNLKGMDMGLDKYVEISEAQVKKLLTNGELLSSDRLNVNNLEFQKVVFTGDQGIYKLKFEQYCWVKND